MNPTAEGAGATDFLAAFIAREGGLAEVDGGGAVHLVLTPSLQQATGLPETESVRILGHDGPGEAPFPLESAGLQWCLERACARGRVAAANLSARSGPAGLAASVAEKVQALNGSLHVRGTRSVRLCVWIFEFHCEAVSEERLEIAEFVAVEPDLRVISAPWARALLDRLPEAEPDATSHDLASVARAASLAEPHARALLAARVEPLRERLERRMARDASRLVEFHQALLDEARRHRRGRDDEAIEKKCTAIVRQRDQKLAELGSRLAIDARTRLASLLEVRYSAPVCDLVLLRKRREIPLAIPWDPFVRGFLAPSCQACAQPTFAWHACDVVGHLTCAVCAKPCVACGRVNCRACQPTGCRACSRAGEERE